MALGAEAEAALAADQQARKSAKRIRKANASDLEVQWLVMGIAARATNNGPIQLELSRLLGQARHENRVAVP